MNKTLIIIALIGGQHLGYAQSGPAVFLQPAATVSLPTGANPSALAISDFNADTRADVAVCEKGLGSIDVYLQSSNSTYPATPTASYAAGQAPTGLVAVNLGTLSSRGNIDLVGVSGPSSQWTVLVNDQNAQGSFSRRTNFPPFGTNQISTSPQLVAGYIDGDQYVDFAYTYDGPLDMRVKWEKYTGGNLIRTGSVIPTNFAAGHLALDDFERDGYTDVVYTNRSANEVVVNGAVPLNGLPYWTNSPYVARLTAGISQPVHVATGDVNRDSQPDVLVANAGSNSLTLYLNLGSTRFGSQVTYPLSAAPRQVALEDLNGDGYPEMIAITADGNLQVFQHTGAVGVGRYTTPQVLPAGPDPTVLQLAYMSSGTIKDIAVACAGDNTVRLYQNRSLAQPTAAAARQRTSVELFPNPATDQLRIRVADKLHTVAARLIDELGRQVREQAIVDGTGTMPVAELPRGLYLLSLTGVDGVITKRVLLQ